MTNTKLAEPTTANRPTVLKKAMLSQMTVPNSEPRRDLADFTASAPIQPNFSYCKVVHHVGNSEVIWEGHMNK